MPTVLDWNPTVDPSELVEGIREALAAGSAAVLPGDSGYVVLINPTAPSAAAHLARFPGPPAVLSWGPDDLVGLGLPVSAIARRLTFRAWPAPLTVAVPGIIDWPAEWPAAVRASLTASGPLRFRCPEHPLLEAAVPALAFPVLVVDTFRSTAEEVLDILDDPGAAAVTVGEMPVEGKPTLVTLTGAGYEITEPGLFPADEIEQFAARLVLSVCTGNTCRSPLAEALAKKSLCDRFGCGPDDLPRRGVWVLSAGVAAHGGSPASAESVAIAAEYGADLGAHQSRPVNPPLLEAADDVIVMTRGHAHVLATHYPGVGPAPRLLCGDADLDDPIGAGAGVYRACADTIVKHLERLLPEWTGQ